MDMQAVKQCADRIRDNIGKVIIGKKETIDLVLTALFSAGHVLLEDVPGTGKTLLAKSLARSIDGRFRRIQFTPDLLPSDVSGIYFFNQKTSEFEFRPGPVFAHILLADEINRATPRTQSSLLESMEERQVTIDGITHKLEQPFLVLATQNPVEHQGTFPLPEAQLDRFLLRVSMGYPDEDETVRMLKRFKQDQPLEQLEPVADVAEIVAAQTACRQIRVSDDLLRYIAQIAEHTRTMDGVILGVSPRGSLALLRAAQSYAAMQGREFMLPDDVKFVAVPTLAHRLVVKRGVSSGRNYAAELIREVLERVPAPADSPHGTDGP